MIYALINIVLYFCLFFYYRKKEKGIDIYQIIVSLYLGTAIMCTINYSKHPNNWQDLGFIPFLYMFVVVSIMFQPIRHFSLNPQAFQWRDNSKLFFLGCFYIILAFLDTYYYYDDTIERITDVDWGKLRNQFYNDEDSIQLYKNQWEKLIKNLLTYLRPFAVIYAFFQTTKKGNITFSILLFLAIIIPTFVTATMVASRGMIFNLTISLILGFLLFKNKMPKRNVYILSICGVIISVLFFIYATSVTVSRFGEDEAGSSVAEYFGVSMLAFNDGVFYNMYDFGYGKNFFAWFIDLFGGDSSFDTAKAGSTHGTAFFTIVGSLYIDWGPIGTIIVAYLAYILISRFTRKKMVMMSDMVIIFFYINLLAAGIFAFGRGRALVWIMTFVVYFIVRLLETKEVPHKITKQELL